ncbi:serine/threonine-protein kinase SIK1 isoform X1 [Silurus asotus]|uniref:non-specific serine/threonine protein kinase n=1 Tax=Silurus asotus TaxID=30991 RepID=A0AAD5AN42_SILAS|nr:serine/threonine-protein kinase SIK1 isoform X1 [Silurus asotus]
MVVLSEVVPDTMNQGGKPFQVGFYEIIRTLGKGNFAVVKLARHKVTKTQVAIKIIDKTRLDASDLEKLKREVKIMKLLNHPHIIRLYQVMESKNMLYIVTEYANNGELFDYLACNGHLSEEEARKIFCQILSAVEYCHKCRIVHRDLKAENVLLDSNMDIKLADFGFGNFFVPGKPLNTWCGSPPYAAPEIFKGKEYEGPQLDIWSLGVVLYVLVCGSLPFDAASLPALKQRVIEGHFRIPYYMSQECENLIRRMLVVDPVKRISLAQIKQHCWLKAVPISVCQAFLNPPEPETHCKAKSYNKQVLSFMQTLGIDKQRTIESLQNDSYNHFSAIYWLLLERLVNEQEQIPKIPAPCFTPPVFGNQLDASTSRLQFRNSPTPSNLLHDGLSRVVQVKNMDDEENHFPVDYTTVNRSMIQRHTDPQVSSFKNWYHPPDIVVDLVDSSTADSSPTSTFTASRISFTSSALLNSQLNHIHGQYPVSINSQQNLLTSSILKFQTSLQVPNFQEGRRASDPSLPQGLWAFHEHLNVQKNVNNTGHLGLNNVPVQHTWLPIPNNEHTNKPPTPSWEHKHGQTEKLLHYYHKFHDNISSLHHTHQSLFCPLPDPPSHSSCLSETNMYSTSSCSFSNMLDSTTLLLEAQLQIKPSSC